MLYVPSSISPLLPWYYPLSPLFRSLPHKNMLLHITLIYFSCLLHILVSFFSYLTILHLRITLFLLKTAPSLIVHHLYVHPPFSFYFYALTPFLSPRFMLPIHHNGHMSFSPPLRIPTTKTTESHLFITPSHPSLIFICLFPMFISHNNTTVNLASL